MNTPKQQLESMHFTLRGLKLSAEYRIQRIRRLVGKTIMCKTDKEKMMWNRINDINQLLCMTGSPNGAEQCDADMVRERLKRLLEDQDYAGNPEVYPYPLT